VSRLRFTLIGTFVLLGLAGFSLDEASGQSGGASFDAATMTDEELEGEIQRRTGDLDRYTEHLGRLERTTREARGALDLRERELHVQQSEARRSVVTLCRLSRGGFVHLLSGAQSWTDLFRRAELARVLARRELGALRDYQSGVEELETRRNTVEQRLTAHRALRERTRTYRQALELERTRRASIATTLPSPPDVAPRVGEGDLSWLDL